MCIRDRGAAGLTCSTCEMGSRAGTGIEIDLSKVPQRETGMTPYEIMLSESQERMLLVAIKGREQEVFDVFEKWGLDAAEIGIVTDTGMLVVKNHGEVVAHIPNRELADEAPLYTRPYTKPPRKAPMEAPAYTAGDLKTDLIRLLSSGDLCSKKWIYEQYDYMVRTNTLAGPGGDAAVVRVKGTNTSVAISLDGNGRYCSLDPREGAKLAVAEACRNVSTVGAEPMAATNNLNFGNPQKPEIMAQLVEAIEGMSEACLHFETPITGGNVSLYNETLGEGIHPTPVMGIVGVMKTGKPTPIEFQSAGKTVILLGGLRESTLTHFGSSQYANVIVGGPWGLPPALDMDYEKRVHGAIRKIVNSQLAESAHDLSDGGLAVALAESTFGGIGAQITLPAAESPEMQLFHEAPSRILISTANVQEIKAIADEFEVEAVVIGTTLAGKLVIDDRIDAGIEELRQPWSTSLERMLHA